MNPAPDTSRRLLACLSDTSRYRIVRLLGSEERCVTEIARAVGLSQSCTTRHLQALARGQVVRRRREGKRVLFRLDDRDPTVRDLLAWLGARPGGAVAVRQGPRDPARRRTRGSRSPGRAGASGRGDDQDAAGPAAAPAAPPRPRPGDLEDYLL